MPRTITSSMLHGGPLRIWSALTDPDHRRVWSPLVFLDSPCQLGDTEYTFAIRGINRRIWTPAQVAHFDKPHAFAWSCGIPNLFTLEARHELAADDGGTTLTHSCTLRGALSLPFAAMMLRRLRCLMIEVENRLAAHLRWRVGQPARGIDRQRTPSLSVEKGAMRTWKAALSGLSLVVGLAACSESKPPAPLTEQQIHSSDSAVATGEVGRHPFRCSDGEALFVDYRADGLQIDLRRSNSGPPMTLTAPAQGLQYVGDTATATFKGSQLTIVEGDGRTRICEREGTR